MIQIDMKLPNCCGECAIGFCMQIGCENFRGYDDYAKNRHPNCPLKEQKAGKWIKNPNGGLLSYYCSECSAPAAMGTMHYCYHCGAKMEVEDESGD